MKDIPFALFIATLVFTPLAFGTVEEWSMTTVQLLIVFTVFFFCLQRRTSPDKLLQAPGLVPLVLLVCFMALQMVPLPPGLVKLLSPASYHAYQPVNELSNPGAWIPMTIYRKETFLEFLRVASYGIFYVLTIQLLSSGDRLKKTVSICCWLAIGIALLAILQKYSSPDKIFWFRSVSTASPIGPWVNRSQYCGYIEMMAPLTLALALFYRPSLNPEESLRQRIVTFFSPSGGNLYMVLGLGVLILVCSAFISLSRGGIIAVSFSLLFFFSLIAWKTTRYSRMFFIGVVGALILSVTWFGWDPIFRRFEQIVDSSGQISIDRFRIWGDVLPLIKDFWLTGSGFGTFIAVFPLYRTFPGREIYDHAHNDYLELLTDGGIIGFALAAWFVIAVLRAGWKMIGRRRDRYARLVGIGALCGISAMLIHGISDFNMHNGAVGLYFFFLCGLLVSAGNTRFYYGMDSTLLKQSTRLSREVFLFCGGILLCALLLGQGGVMLARWKYAEVSGIYLNRQLEGKLLSRISVALQEASRFDPMEPIYSSLQGDVQRYLRQPEKALEFYVEAGRKDPLNGAYLQQIGMMLPKDRQDLAARLVEKGVETTLHKDELLLARVEWLLETGQRQAAIAAVRKGLEQNPKMVKAVIPLLQGFSLTRQELTASLPQSVDIWLQTGSFLEKLGSIDEAVYFREHALDFLEGERVVKPDWFSQLYNYYRQRQDEDRALEIVRLGLAKIPEHPRFREWLGDYYAKEAISYRALEEYGQVLQLEPGNASVRKKIEKLTSRQVQ